MIKNLKIILLIFLMISACGYQPLLIREDISFSFKTAETVGNDRLSFRLLKNLNHLRNKDGIYNIKIEVKEEKSIASKDEKGNPAIFNLMLKAIIELDSGNNQIIETFSENLNYNNQKNKFDLKKFEDQLRLSLVDKLSQNILFFLQSV